MQQRNDQHNNRMYILPLIVIGGALLRLVLIGRIPYGLNQDEASIGYDAWSLLHYGIDRNGYPWPIYPITWGSGGGSPLMIYLTLLSTRLLGRSILSLRIIPAILGAVTPLIAAFVMLAKSGAGRNSAQAESSSTPKSRSATPSRLFRVMPSKSSARATAMRSVS